MKFSNLQSTSALDRIEKKRENRLFYQEILSTLALASDIDNEDYLNHSWRVAVLGYEIAELMALPTSNQVFYAGLVHDIGAIGLDTHAVHIDDLMTASPQAQTHSHKTARILGPLSLLQPLEEIVTDHHEHYDGSGAPLGKKGNSILLETSILVLADRVEWYLTRQENGQLHDAAQRFVRQQNGKMFKPEVAYAATQLFDERPTLIDQLYDDDALKVLIEGANVPLPSSEPISETKIVNQLLFVFARMIDAKHTYTAGHSTRVAYYAHQIASALGPWHIDSFDVLCAGMLHDVGKLAVPKNILDKPTRLSPEEREIVERHSLWSKELISRISRVAYLAYPAAAHHERYGGGGYPEGRSGENIPLISRVLAFADVFDALTSSRSYRPASSPAEAIETMRGMLHSHLDPNLAPLAFNVLSISHQEHAVADNTLGLQMLSRSRSLKDAGDLAFLRRGQSTKPLDLEVLTKKRRDLRVAIRLSENLELASGHKALYGLSSAFQEGFLDGLTSASRNRLQSAILSLSRDQAVELPLESQDGDSFGLVLSMLVEGGYIGHIESTGKRLSAGDQLALSFRGFLRSSEAVVLTNPQGQVVDANQSFLELYNYEGEDLIGASLERLLDDGESPSETLDEMRRCVSDQGIGSWSGELSTRRKDGEEIHSLTTVQSIRSSTGEVLGFLGQSVDISERKRLEARLQEWASFAELAPYPLLRLDRGSRILLANRASLDCTGRNRLIGSSWATLCKNFGDEEIRLLCHDRVMLQREEHFGPRHFLFTYLYVPSFEYIYVYGTDFTNRKRNEQKIIAQDIELQRKNDELQNQSRLKSELMAMVSHDIRSPLNSIQAMSTLLDERHCSGLETDTAHRYLQKIVGETERLRALAEDLLEAEQLESGSLKIAPRTLFVEALLQECIETHQGALTNEAELRLSVEGSPPPVRVDPQRLRQVVSNLVTNAVKFSPKGSPIDLRYRFDDHWAIIDICDRGPGIPLDALEHIFDKFFQVERKGAVPTRGFGVGLGLSIVRGIVKAHGGFVRARNRVGSGACFTVNLPRHHEATSSKFTAFVLDPDGRLEDSEMIFRSAGVEVEHFNSPSDTEELLRHERPEILMTEMSSMTIDLALRLKSIRSGEQNRPLVIGVSGPRTASEEWMVDAILDLPILDVELRELIERVRFDVRSSEGT